MDRKEILIKFGENLRALRLSRKLSQERLSELVGLDRTYIGLVEGCTNSYVLGFQH